MDNTAFSGQISDGEFGVPFPATIFGSKFGHKMKFKKKYPNFIQDGNNEIIIDQPYEISYNGLIVKGGQFIYGKWHLEYQKYLIDSKPMFTSAILGEWEASKN